MRSDPGSIEAEALSTTTLAVSKKASLASAAVRGAITTASAAVEGVITAGSADITGSLSAGGDIKANGTVVSKTISSSSIQTETVLASTGHLQHLHVNGTADFASSVFMERSLTVQGTVVGSGPYIDSSDSRFKKNVEPLESALDKVARLEGVTYHLKVDEFPERNFGHSRQVGWIADDVEQIIPELVTIDQEGYRSVAYGRSAPLIAQAVRVRTDGE